MKIVIAPDSYKGSNTSIMVANRIEKGIRVVFADAEIVKIPIADGGEGTVEALVAGAGGTVYKTAVVGPMGEKREAEYGILDSGMAAIEMAASSGLPLVPEEKRNPLIATTYGVGQLIKTVLDKGCKEIVLGIGGSATNDGGMGMAQALGVSFKDSDGNELGYGGGALAKLSSIDVSGLDPRVKDAKITIASDVNNPLCGPTGAAAIFGPQKGADAPMIKVLDQNLAHYAKIVREQLGVDHAETPGAGAAGGLGFGLLVFLGAVLNSGIETMLDSVNIDQALDGCDLVITGEGKIDGQSAFGKVPVGVAQRVKKYGIPVLAIVGDIGDGAEAVYQYGIDSIMSTVNKAMPLKEAIAHSGDLLEEATVRAMRMIKIGLDIAR
ncbi:MAG: glycerate kinase [Oscillospiraceae bacterium]|jgi:glycerate kinase|nr:glycerate kinase [Oscillospiraceae bacterium]